MSIEVKVPVLPESVSEAILLNWHKNVGDTVSRDENLVDLETEKVVLEVPAPENGVIKQLVKQNGDTVLSDEVLAIIEPGAAVKSKPPAAVAVEPATESRQPGGSNGAGLLSPSARKLATENNVDLSQIAGSGKDGRVTKGDILRHLEKQPGEAKSPAPSKPVADTDAPLSKPGPSKISERGERREPMSRLRATIASRLKNAQNTAAMLTTFNDVNLQAVMDLRQRHKESFEKQYGARLGFMSFFVKAAVEGLRRFPAINAYIEDNDIVYHDFCDIGIAVSSPRGLVVPILRDAQQMSFAAIEKQISAFGAKAKDGKLTMEELTGGTFTITNGGVFGSMLSTPILNPPQSAILGMHRIEQRPVAENGDVVIRPMMYLALTYDHRIVDGAEAVRFLVTIKETLEDPARLMLQI